MNQTTLRKYVVPVTALLSFVSFWRASAIVLCDLGSSAYYVGGDYSGPLDDIPFNFDLLSDAASTLTCD